MITRCYLPDSITLPCGAVLEPVISGAKDSLIIKEAKRRKLKYRRVKVLSRNLMGRNDLHGLPYCGTIWVFVQVNGKTDI